jgi:hypothetical protein
MKDNLLYWCNVVERATRLVEFLKTNLNAGCETFDAIFRIECSKKKRRLDTHTEKH